VVARLPLAALNQQSRVGQLLVAAAVIEMEMRVDDEIDLRRRNAERLDARRDLLAGFESDRVILRETSKAAVRIGLRVDVKTGVEDRPALRMLDQIRGHWNGEAPLFAREQQRGRKRQPSAGERI